MMPSQLVCSLVTLGFIVCTYTNLCSHKSLLDVCVYYHHVLDCMYTCEVYLRACSQCKEIVTPDVFHTFLFVTASGCGSVWTFTNSISTATNSSSSVSWSPVLVRCCSISSYTAWQFHSVAMCSSSSTGYIAANLLWIGDLGGRFSITLWVLQ